MTEIIITPLTEEEIAEQEALKAEAFQRALEQVRQIRQSDYQRKADPIFFEWQRGEKTEQEWLDAVQEVNDANPYPVFEDSEKTL